MASELNTHATDPRAHHHAQALAEASRRPAESEGTSGGRLGMRRVLQDNDAFAGACASGPNRRRTPDPAWWLWSSLTIAPQFPAPRSRQRSATPMKHVTGHPDHGRQTFHHFQGEPLPAAFRTHRLCCPRRRPDGRCRWPGGQMSA